MLLPFYLGEVEKLKDCITSLEQEMKKVNESEKKLDVELTVLKEDFHQKENDFYRQLNMKPLVLGKEDGNEQEEIRRKDKQDEVKTLREEIRELKIFHVGKVELHSKWADEATVSWYMAIQ